MLKGKDKGGALSTVHDFEYDPVGQATKTVYLAVPTCLASMERTGERREYSYADVNMERLTYLSKLRVEGRKEKQKQNHSAKVRCCLCNHLLDTLAGLFFQ